MTMSQSSLNHVYRLLTMREAARVAYSDPRNTSPIRRSPEEVFYSVANSLKYRSSNRYSNILAYDRTAVQVKGGVYLNANVVRDGRGNWWVASQAPVPRAFHSFLRAIYTQAASAHPAIALDTSTSTKGPRAVILVQLTGWEENGVAKADRYIPYAPPLIREMMTDLDSDDGSGQSTSFTDISGSNKMYLQLTKQRRVPELSSVVTEMCLHSEDGAHVLSPHEASGAGEEGSMTVFHYHYDAWPDHGVPEGQAVVALRRLIMEIARRREDLGGCELWVHCSAGVGRTGAFIALSSLLCPPPASPLPPSVIGQSPLGPLPADLADDPIAQTIDGIREWRGLLVQNQDQMQLVYDMVRAELHAG